MVKVDADALVLFQAGPQILVMISLSHSILHRVGGHLTSGSRHLTFSEIPGGRKETYLAAHAVSVLCKVYQGQRQKG